MGFMSMFRGGSAPKPSMTGSQRAKLDLGGERAASLMTAKPSAASVKVVANGGRPRPVKVTPKGKTTSYVATDQRGKQRRVVIDEDQSVYGETRNKESGALSYKHYGSMGAQSPIRTDQKRNGYGASKTGISYDSPEETLAGKLGAKGISVEREVNNGRGNAWYGKPGGYSYVKVTPKSPTPKESPSDPQHTRQGQIVARMSKAEKSKEKSPWAGADMSVAKRPAITLHGASTGHDSFDNAGGHKPKVQPISGAARTGEDSFDHGGSYSALRSGGQKSGVTPVSHANMWFHAGSPPPRAADPVKIEDPVVKVDAKKPPRKRKQSGKA